jgi:hypothetical protein
MTKIRQRKSSYQLFNIQILITYLDYWEFHQGRLSFLIPYMCFCNKKQKKTENKNENEKEFIMYPTWAI